jgi:hypothetical protein
MNSATQVAPYSLRLRLAIAGTAVSWSLAAIFLVLAFKSV